MSLLLEPLDGAIVDPPEGVELDPSRTIRIGRAGNSELKVHDQLVEVYHARLYFDPSREQWIIEDLQSKHGTFVNGECLRDSAKVIRAGAELRFGDSRIRLRRSFGYLPWWALPVGGVPAVLVVIAFIALYLFFYRPSSEEYIEVDNFEVTTSNGHIDKIKVDAEFLRERGLSWNLRIHRVLDSNEDGINEIWFDVAGTKELIITFGEGERWLEVGLMPLGGGISSGPGYPEVYVKGERWRLDAQIEQYRPFEHDAPVVWYREDTSKPKPQPSAGKSKGLSLGRSAPAPAPAPAPDPVTMPGIKTLTPLKVRRMPLRDAELLGQFLSERGVHVPIHYLICEGAFEGIRAQVLTYDNEIIPLETGCIAELHMEEPPGRPYAIALTPAGRRALVDDVVTFYTGAPDGLFQDGNNKTIIQEVSAEPSQSMTGRLFARPMSPVPGHNPIPAIGAQVPGIHDLFPNLLSAPAPRAQTVTIVTPGQPFDYPLGGGCEVLRVTIHKFEPTPFGEFATVEEVSCTPGAPTTVLEIPYKAGFYPARVGTHPIQFYVEAEELAGQARRVLRARLSWR